jgi:hypothetical protein
MAVLEQVLAGLRQHGESYDMAALTLPSDRFLPAAAAAAADSSKTSAAAASELSQSLAWQAHTPTPRPGKRVARGGGEISLREGQRRPGNF